jgi:hypothetical protein
MPKGIRLPRHAQQLPVELVQRNSDLDVLITIAGDSTEKRTFGFESTVKITRRVIHQNCSSYRPSTSGDNAVLCRSGEDTGNPYRGEACFSCRAGQFSKSGVFIGEMAEASAYNSVNPVVAQQSELILSDFIKALEESN